MAAGVSMTTTRQSAGILVCQLRVTAVDRSNAAMPWIGGASFGRLRSQRMLEACGSRSINAGRSPFAA
jgi:hypothetical protein